MKQFFMRGLCLALWCAAAHAEFLIVKKIQDKDGKEIFAPLDFEDKSDNAAAPIITQILLKYEWPMCTAADLTEAEMAELLAPDVPQAEENFIQKKLDSALKNIGRYSIVFIPTSLYELLCMQCYFENEKSLDPLGKRIRISAGDALTRKYEYKNPGETHKKFFKDAAALKKEILGIFIAQNEQAFGIVPMKSNPFFIANNYVLKNIFTTVDLATSSDVEVLVTTIQKKMDDIIKSAVLLADHTRALENIGLNSETKNRIIPKVVALEYEARMVNKGLLFRGAYFTAIESATFLSEKLPVLGMPFISSAGKYETINALLKDVTPYSVSYGTSLFAGTVYDADACAYGYLSGTQAWKHSQGGATGYALFINKKEYMESQNNNLFFIPPLAPLISLFASGEYFHARAKVSISKKTKELLVIQGLCEAIIEDPFGFLVVTRDPFKHAQLFSNFLAKNGRIIQTGDSSSLAEEEKNFVEQVMKNQAQTTRLLKDMRTAVPPVRKALRKRVEQNAAKKAEVEKKREAQQAEQAEAERKKMEPLIAAIQRADFPSVKKLIRLEFNPNYEMPMQFGGKEEKVNLWGLASKLRLNKIREVIERGKEPTGEEIKFLVNMNHIVSELLKKNVVWNWEEQTEYYRLIKNPLLEGVRKAWLRSRADEHDKEQEEKRRMEQLANAIEQADVPAVRALVEQPFDPDYKVTVELNGKEETLYLGELVERLRLAKERAIVARGTKPTKEEIKFIVDISRILNVLSKHGVALELVSDEDYENFMRNPFLEDVRKARRQENFD